MRGRLRHLASSLLAWSVVMLAGGALARPAHAELMFFTGNPNGFHQALHSAGVDQANIMFNADGLELTGYTIEGYVNQSNFQRLAISSSTVITGEGQPAQSITAPSGTFLDATFIPHLENVENFSAFQSLSFNVDATNDSGAVVVKLFNVDDELIDSHEFNMANGNFFGVVATNGETFYRADLMPSSGDGGTIAAAQQALADPETAIVFFDRISQIRAGLSSGQGTTPGGGGGGGGGGGEGGTTVTPEPSTLLMWLAVGLTAAVWLRFRKRRAPVAD